MDSRFVLQHVPNADPTFLKIVAVIAVSGTAAVKISEVLPVLHQLFIQKREAFHRGDWRMFHSAIDREAELIAQVAS